MSWYRVGTVTVTSGSDMVTGASTVWLGMVDVGWAFLGPDGKTYEVLNVVSDTSLQLATNYAGSTLSGQSYAMYPTQGLTRTLATGVAALVTAYGGLAAAVTADDVGAVHFGSTADTGMWPDVTSTAKIHRAWGRMFIGDAADVTGNRTGTQDGKVPNDTVGASWAIRDAQFASFAQQGNIAIVGFSRSGDADPAQPTSGIGVAGFVIGDNPLKSCWGMYSDVQHESGPYAYGIEIATKNVTGVDHTSTPYFATEGVYGIWLPGGGDFRYGGTPTHPNNTAIAIGKNSHTWNRGIVFFQDGLTRSGSGYATAMHLAEKHRIVWATSGNYEGFAIRSDVDSASSDVSLTASNSSITLGGVGGATMLRVSHASSGVNYATFSNAAAGNYPTWRSAGADPDIGWFYVAKGTAPHRFCAQNSVSYEEFRVGGINAAPVNYLHAYGTDSGAGYAVLSAGGTDSTVDVWLKPKGVNGRVRLGPYASSGDVAITGTMEVRDTSGVLRLVAIVG